MEYNFENESEIYLAKNHFNHLIDNKKRCKIEDIKKKRSPTENKALHLWMKHISDGLNELGETFHYFGVFGKEFEMRFTENIIKEFIIKPLIKTLFNIDSTTKLTTDNINELIDVINKYMGLKGLYLPWPSIQSMQEYFK